MSGSRKEDTCNSNTVSYISEHLVDMAAKYRSGGIMASSKLLFLPTTDIDMTELWLQGDCTE